MSLHRAFGLFGEVRRSGVFSSVTLDALRVIRRCALVLLGFVAGGVVIISLHGDPDDRPAGFFLALLITLGTTAVVAATSFATRHLRRTLADY